MHRASAVPTDCTCADYAEYEQWWPALLRWKAVGGMSGDSETVIDGLLEAIRRHLCVYDTKRMDYRYRVRKMNAWEIIRSQYEATFAQVSHAKYKALLK